MSERPSFEQYIKEIKDGTRQIPANISDVGRMKILPPSFNNRGMTMAPGEECMKKTMLNGGVGIFSGVFYGAVNIAWYPDPLTDRHGKVADKTPFRAILGRVMQPAVLCGLATTVYTLSECTIEGNRQKKDAWNAVYAGYITGFMIGGLAFRRFDSATATSVLMGFAMGISDLCGPGQSWNRSHGVPDDVGVRPLTHVESPELRALKEKYPKFADL